MKLTVLVEKIGDDRYTAKIWEPFQIESEGQTLDEAVQRVRELAASRIGAGKLVQISIPDDQDRSPPWARWAGLWKDNPDIDDYLANIEEYRRNADGNGSSS
jgi:predicted RNase H-like HicB family nuclease